MFRQKNITDFRSTINIAYKWHSKSRFVFLEGPKETTDKVAGSTESNNKLPSWESVENQLTPQERAEYQKKLDDYMKVSEINKKNLAILSKREQKLMQDLEFASWEKIENSVRDIVGPGLGLTGAAVGAGTVAAPFSLAAVSVYGYYSAVDNIMIKIDSMNLEEVRQVSYEMDNYSNRLFNDLQKYKLSLRKKYA